MSVQELSEFTRFSRYAKHIKDKKKRESWDEQTNRVIDMHEVMYGDKLKPIQKLFDRAKQHFKGKLFLGSQRALQFGGEPILKKHARLYNCSASYADRPRFFAETFWLLLCGTGVGFSVQKPHVEQLPMFIPPVGEEVVHVIEDSIEGWSDAVSILLNSYLPSWKEFPTYINKKVSFDGSQIRPEGSPLSWGGKAPGPNGLLKALENVRTILETVSTRDGRMKPIEACDVVCHLSDAVLAGGVRRSATIVLFSPDDEEMMSAKTGNWFDTNPQRARANISVLLIRNETSFEDFQKMMTKTKEFGEPGFVWADHIDSLFNPCVEASLYSKDEFGNSGWQFCNLCTVNAARIRNKRQFLRVCASAAVFGTLQAGYTSVPYLGEVTERILKREALLGVSMTGIMDNPNIALNPKVLKQGAKIVLDTNELVAKVIGINPCARSTLGKPEGSTSCLLGTASGCNAHHSKRYFRLVQNNFTETAVQHFMKINPQAIEESVWSANQTDVVTRFLIDTKPNAILKGDLTAIKHLDYVKLVQKYWVMPGTRKEANVKPWLCHNVSNTITVQPHEWDKVTKHIYANRQYFCGISLLSSSGDKDYIQAPFCEVFTKDEIIEKYHLVKSSWDSIVNVVETIHKYYFVPPQVQRTQCEYSIITSVQLFCKDVLYGFAPRNKSLGELHDYYVEKQKEIWSEYMKAQAEVSVSHLHLLQDVANCLLWTKLKKSYRKVDWSTCVEDVWTNDKFGKAGEACSGGKCETNW